MLGTFIVGFFGGTLFAALVGAALSRVKPSDRAPGAEPNPAPIQQR